MDALRLEVRFLGAVNEEDRAAEKQALAFQRLGFEMAEDKGVYLLMEWRASSIK